MYFPPQPPRDGLRGCQGIAVAMLLSLLLWAGLALLLWWLTFRG